MEPLDSASGPVAAPDLSSTASPTVATPPTQPAGSGKAIAALVLGIVGMIAWIIPLFGLPITIIGLVLGIKGRATPKRGLAVAGMVLSIIGLVLSIGNFAIGAYQGATESLNTIEDLLPASTGEVYDGGAFTVRPPEGWRIDSSGRGGAAVAFFGSRANVNVVVEEGLGSMNLDEYVVASKEALSTFTNYQPLLDERVSPTHHRLGARFSSDTDTVRNIQDIYLANGTAYIVTGTTLIDTWEEEEAGLRAVMGTFSLR